MQILLSAGWWFFPLCIATGIAYAYLLYKPRLQTPAYRLMAVLRALSVSLLSFFLLGPVLIHSRTEEQKPLVLMVLDNSESVAAGPEGRLLRNNFAKAWNRAGNTLGPDYNTVFLEIGSDIKPYDSAHFSHKKTNLSSLFDHVNNTYAGQNIGAVVLASDGIYNRGNNPLYKSLNRQIPLYTVGLGDSSVKKDLLIKEAACNAIAYLNNSFPVELGIAANQCTGGKTTLTLSSAGKILYSETLNIDRDQFYKTVNCTVTADKPGHMHLTATLSTLTGEHTVVNNRKDIFIDIIDGREKILLAYAGPHPDIGAIKTAIGSNRNYEIVSLPLREIPLQQLNQYSVAILHQLPGRGFNSTELIQKLRAFKIPVWSICGSQSAVEQLQQLSPAARIDRHQGRFNDVQALLKPSFNLFTLSNESREIIGSLPPLKTPYGLYAAGQNTEVLLQQKIGTVSTETPLWAFADQNGEKTAFLFGEGIWRWRLAEYAKYESAAAVDELIGKTIQFLALKEDRRRFRVYPVKEQFEEDEAVRFSAELYNASYEPVDNADIRMLLTQGGGKTFDYHFSKSGNAYRLDLGRLAPGVYTYSATAEGVKETVKGKFIVQALQTELLNTRADFGLLRQLSATHSGKFFRDTELENLYAALRENPEISSISIRENRPDELINLKWVFFVLLTLIGAEWFLRKYEGGY